MSPGKETSRPSDQPPKVENSTQKKRDSVAGERGQETLRPKHNLVKHVDYRDGLDKATEAQVFAEEVENGKSKFESETEVNESKQHIDQDPAIDKKKRSNVNQKER